MMTLDGAIKHAKEVAEKNEEDFRLCPSQECDGTQDCRCLKNGEGNGCLKCAAEYRQLAEWLKELKAVQDITTEMQEILNYLDTTLHPIVSPDNWYVYSELYDMVSALPCVQPEIIACADCKHWICHDRRCGFWNHGVKPLDWCCYVERREE